MRGDSFMTQIPWVRTWTKDQHSLQWDPPSNGILYPPTALIFQLVIHSHFFNCADIYRSIYTHR